jgi:hypothetical protein
VSAVAFGAGLTLPANTNWEQVPATLPVIIFTLVFHDIAPGTCNATYVIIPRMKFATCKRYKY